MKKAVCLLSGGLDSTTALYSARRDSFETIALTVHYGQLHHKEMDCAKAICDALGVRQYSIEISLPWGGSALLDPTIEIPKGRSESTMQQNIPPTYVPARNSIFLTLAASCAEAEGADAIFIGANILDYSGYPDCRPEYFLEVEKMLEKGTKAGAEGNKIKIHAPLLHLNKKEIILLGCKLGVPFEKTWSCYEGKSVPCGQCDSCLLREKGFREAGLKDPLLTYVASAVR